MASGHDFGRFRSRASSASNSLVLATNAFINRLLVQQAKSSAQAGCGNLLDQIDRASESIVLNIAEGCGKKRGSRDRAKYYRIASASAAECAAAWDLLNIRCNAITASARSGKQLCIRIAMMLSG